MTKDNASRWMDSASQLPDCQAKLNWKVGKLVKFLVEFFKSEIGFRGRGECSAFRWRWQYCGRSWDLGHCNSGFIDNRRHIWSRRKGFEKVRCVWKKPLGCNLCRIGLVVVKNHELAQFWQSRVWGPEWTAFILFSRDNPRRIPIESRSRMYLQIH